MCDFVYRRALAGKQGIYAPWVGAYFGRRKESPVMSLDAEIDLALAELGWQIDLGATEAIGDVPVNRYEVAARDGDKGATTPAAPVAVDQPAAPLVVETGPDALAGAVSLAAGARTLADLKTALAGFDGCELKKGARNLVFADGNPAARLMIVGEAPGRDEDIEGLPFVGRAGRLLDKMLDAIDMARGADDAARAVYITNVMPWRPPHNRDPAPEEIAMMLPFVRRHIALIAPEVIVPMGNIACQALLGQKGITRLRGHWSKVDGIAALPMFHPAYLLRNGEKKRESWADLLEIMARLKGKKNVSN